MDHHRLYALKEENGSSRGEFAGSLVAFAVCYGLLLWICLFAAGLLSQMVANLLGHGITDERLVGISVVATGVVAGVFAFFIAAERMRNIGSPAAFLWPAAIAYVVVFVARSDTGIPVPMALEALAWLLLAATLAALLSIRGRGPLDLSKYKSEYDD